MVALATLWDDPSSAPFVLTAIGLALVIVGVYVVSNVWKEPHYDVMLAWDPETMPATWEWDGGATTHSTGSSSWRRGRRSPYFWRLWSPFRRDEYGSAEDGASGCGARPPPYGGRAWP